MRILISSLDQPKDAAKRLARLSPALKLAKVHEELAQALGYRDWHELTMASRSEKPVTQLEDDKARGSQIIASLAEALNLPETEVQYAVSKARLLQDSLRTLEDQITLRGVAWRQRLFGPPGKGKSGTVVNVKADGTTRVGYLKSLGRPSFLIFDTGLGSCADFQVSVPRVPLPDFVPACLWLPYGYWTLRHGSEVIFSRGYFPMWRSTTAGVERIEPWLWINGIVSEHHFAGAGTSSWASGSARDLALAHLERNRVRELPKLVGIMPYLLNTEVSTIGDAVARLYRQGCKRAVPSYARHNTRLCQA